MTARKRHTYEVNALLYMSYESEELIRTFFATQPGIQRNRISTDLHLTVYHARRRLPGLREGSWPTDITIDTSETRFMVLAPGGENPRHHLEPGKRSVGIRITKRNQAIEEIQRLRSSVYRYETSRVIGSRTPSSAWKNCFGSRNYQPHITMLRPGSRIQRDLTTIGKAFRSEIGEIHLDLFRIASRVRHGGVWIKSP